MFRYLRAKLPHRRQVVRHWSIRPFAHMLNHPRHWRLHRNGVARGIFIGLICAWNPIPGTQMASAAIWAALVRANIPTAVAATWLTNPLTFVPLYVGAFWIGDQLLKTVLPSWQSEPFSIAGLWSKESALIPLLLGCTICAIPTGYVGYWFTKFVWRRHILAKRERQLRRRISGSSNPTQPERLST